MARIGTHELPVTEMMWRLTDSDDLALDVGANIGYYTSLLARRARKVIAFEPHPALSARLRENAANWSYGEIVIEERAASDKTGKAELLEPSDFDLNSGTASLEDSSTGSKGIEVETVRLDELLDGEKVGVLKVDVEGHELAVLEGLGECLGAGQVRDVFFEDHEPIPTPVSELLASNGYRVFSLEQKFRGVSLGPADGPAQHWYSWAAPTYLATRDPERAEKRAGTSGWHCLRPR